MVDKNELSSLQIKSINDIKDNLRNIYSILNSVTQNERISSIAKTNLEQSLLWCERAIELEFKN